MLRHKTMLTALALQSSLAASALAQTPPNLIFIMTDDQGIDAIDWPLHLIATAFTGSPPHHLRVLPMPSGTPIS